MTQPKPKLRLKDLKAWRELPPLPKQWKSLSHAFRASVLKFPDRRAVVDTTGEKLTYAEAWLRAIGLARLLSKKLDNNPYVGVLLPPMDGPAVVEIALTLLGRIPINLNYTAAETVGSPIKQCGVTQLITTQKVLSKGGFEFGTEIIDLDEVRREFTTRGRASRFSAAWLSYNADRAWIGAVSKLLKAGPLALSAFLPGFRRGQEDLAVILFTTGSTAEPKGVELTHKNILTNAWQVYHHAKLTGDETILGVLPFFHSLGYTVTLWTVLCLGLDVAFHYSPLEVGKVGDMMEKEGVSVMMLTPTFMRGFLKRCKPEQFAKVKWLMLGSEKTKPELARDIQAKLGKTPVEGWGTTETAPVISSGVMHDVVTPDGRTVPGNKLGSVGQAVPGTIVVCVREEDWKQYGDEAEVLAAGEEGIFVVLGDQVMKGYHKKPEKTAEVLRHRWYYTGDVGFVDADGFIFITDRADRFAKVGPEKVPLGAIEEMVKFVAGINDELCVSATNIEDEKKGERIIVVYTNLNGLTPAEVVERMVAYGKQDHTNEPADPSGEEKPRPLPNLWLPGANDFLQIEVLPTAGSGKLDLKGVKKYARENAKK